MLSEFLKWIVGKEVHAEIKDGRVKSMRIFNPKDVTPQQTALHRASSSGTLAPTFKYHAGWSVNFLDDVGYMRCGCISARKYSSPPTYDIDEEEPDRGRHWYNVPEENILERVDPKFRAYHGSPYR